MRCTLLKVHLGEIGDIYSSNDVVVYSDQENKSIKAFMKSSSDEIVLLRNLVQPGKIIVQNKKSIVPGKSQFYRLHS